MTIIDLALVGDDHVNTAGRVDEAHRVHEAMLDEWVRRRVHFLGIAGDWNEQPPNEQDQAWSRNFLGRCAMRFPVVIEPGNHDPEGSLLEFHLQNEYKYPITVVTKPDVIVVETEAGPLAVACVPFVWKAHLLANLGPLSVEESDRIAQEELSKIFLGLGAQVRALGLPTVALIHGKWRGSKLNEEQPNRPLGMEIPVEDIGQIGAHVSCVGHIHLAQATSWNGWPILTPSSCYYVDYGEAKHSKGWVLAQIPADAHNITPELVKVERIPTPVTPMILFEDTWSRDEDGGTWAFNAPWPDANGCDIRFRFNYPKEHEKEAKGAAKTIIEGLLAQGAVSIKPDPVPIPAESTRSLEIVKAKTLPEQAQLLWKKWDLKLSDQEARTLTERIEEIQAQCGFGQRLTLDAGIHVKSTRMKGWRCFPNEVSLDFDAIDGQVIAVSGPNGTGKSLAFELMIPGAMFREVPTHGNIGDHAIARDTFVETNFEYAGNDYTVSQIIDGQSGAGSTSLKTGTTPVFGTETALRTQYDKWAAENLPPLSLVTATTFMPQESKGILGMGATARKSLILKAKGVERYEVLAEAGRKRSAAVSKELDKARAKLEELGTGQTVAFCEQSLAKAQDEKRTADEALRLGELTLKDLQDKNATTEKLRTEHGAMVARRRELEAQEQKLQLRVIELDQLITNCQTVLSEKETIEAADEQVKSLTAALADLRAGEAELRVQLSESQGRAREKCAELQRLNEKLAGLNRSIENARKVLADKDKIESAAARVVELSLAIPQAESERDAAFKEYEDLQGASLSTVEGSRTFLRGELRYIAGGNADDPMDYADSALSADDAAMREAAERPQQVLAAKAAWQQASDRAKEIAGQLVTVTRLADRASEIKDAEQITEEAAREIAELRSLGEELPEEIFAAKSAIADFETALASKATTAATTQSEITRLTPLANKAGRIEEAQTKIVLRREEREAVASEREAALESLSRVITDTVEPPPLIPLSEHELAVTQARSAASGCQGAFVLAEKALETAQAQETRRQELSGQIKESEKDVDRWNLIERTVGKDGLIAESVAAAGDEINEKANALLRVSGNTKYTIDLKTTRMTKDGREVEGCPINVCNSETGQWQEGSTLSPGQRAFVNLPTSLTLAEIGCKDSTVKPTIFLDEPTAGLDPIMRIQFVAMMRDVAQRLDAKIFFVSHNEELAALADGRIHIEAGAITVT